MNSQIMTLEEVADHLKVGVGSVYKLARSGEVPGFKVVNKWRFDRRAIELFIEKMSLKR